MHRTKITPPPTLILSRFKRHAVQPNKKRSNDTKERTIELLKMAKILLVSDSNVANNLNLIKSGKIKNLKFVKCVDKKEFSTAIMEAEVDTDIIMVAAFDAIANEVAKKPGFNDRAIEVIYSHFCMKLFEKTEDSDIKIGIIPPLYWRAHSKETIRAMKHSYELLKKDLNNFLHFAPDLPQLKTLSDRIHLTERSGEHYIKFIYQQIMLWHCLRARQLNSKIRPQTGPSKREQRPKWRSRRKASNSDSRTRKLLRLSRQPEPRQSLP